MKTSKLLNKKNSFFIILFLFFSFSSFAEDEPVDIWNIEKTNDEEVKIEENETTTEVQEQIVEQQEINTEDLKIDKNIVRSETCFSRYKNTWLI